MPPVSRIEGSSHSKRCARLRCVIRDAINSMFEPICQANRSLSKHAVQLDLEKYYDIYEITCFDLEYVENIESANILDFHVSDSLHDIGMGIAKLQTMRRILLCTLLALDAEGGRGEYSTWSNATDIMMTLSSMNASKSSDLHHALGDGEGE